MNWDGLKGKIGSIAPVLGGAIGGPAGATVGALISSALGSNDPAEIADFIDHNPEARVKIKQIEAQHAQAIAEIQLRHAANEASDRQDARANHQHSLMPSVICIVLTAGLMAFGGALMVIDMPEQNVRLIDTLFGSYLTAWLSSIAYWVGTTRGSAEKTHQMRIK